MTQEQKTFPYIARLLQGAEVVWTTLGDEKKIEIANANRRPVKASERISGNIPYYGANNIQDYVEGYTHEGIYILIAEDGTKSIENYSVQWATGKFWANNHVHVLRGKNNVDSRFIYYYLQTVNFVPFLTGGDRAKLTKAKLLEIPIPLPPLSVQQEIVRILDKFTQLEAELEAELDCRKRQYEYYRNKLLSYEGNEVEWKTLGEVGEIRMCKRILKEQTSDYGEVPFYKIGTFGKEADAYISKELFNEYRSKYNYPNVGDILISASGTIGRTVIFDGKEAYFQDSNIVWIENDQKKVHNKYLFYCYQIAKWNISEGGTIQRLYNENLRKTLIPIPYPNNPKKSLEEQNRIVAILDKFDTLVNSISEGLPKEIALRRKQYEYYRERLLLFPS